jgi:hypothetical protein
VGSSFPQRGRQGRVWGEAVLVDAQESLLSVLEHHVQRETLVAYQRLFQPAISRPMPNETREIDDLSMSEGEFNVHVTQFQDHFVITDYPFDMSKYKGLARPGLWRIDLFVSQDHEDSHITKIGMSIFNSVTVVEE